MQEEHGQGAFLGSGSFVSGTIIHGAEEEQAGVQEQRHLSGAHEV